MQRRVSSIWRNADFLKLWGGETVSLFGSQITVLALPLTAILTLQATPAQVGLLGAARFAPFVLFTAFAGVWVDRHRRRPILIAANLGRAILLGLIPLLAILGRLRIEHLYLVAFLVGSLQVFFDLSYRSFLPSLVTREHLVDANSKLQLSSSAAEIGGPGLGGLLVQLLTAPFALLFDAVSFLVSMVGLLLIRRPEPALATRDERQGFWKEISEGARLAFGNPFLRAIGLEAATYNLFETLILTLFVVYATRELGIPAAMLGLLLGTGSVGALLGSFLAQSTERRFGFGPTLIGAMTLACIAPLVIPLASGPATVVSILLMLAFFINGIGLAVSNIQAVSLRQLITPDHMLGRVNASYLLVVYGAMPVGALVGGILGSWLGLRMALLIGTLGLLVALLWVVFSPVRGLRRLPTEEDASLLLTGEAVTRNTSSFS